MSKQKVIRWIISGTLLAAVALVGVTVYQVETSKIDQVEEEEQQVAEAPDHVSEETDLAEIEENVEDETDTTQAHHATVTDEEEELPEAEVSQPAQAAEDVSSADVNAEVEVPVETASEEVGASVLPELNFTEETLMSWPVGGQVILDYSMDHSIYFPTLDVYKYNPSIVVGASIGDPVMAASNAKIISIEESTETGTTITADLGNGYQAVYGQLADVQVAADDVVAEGVVLGYVNEPTHFYTEEGSNLYFAMTKDGESIDPIVYLP